MPSQGKYSGVPTTPGEPGSGDDDAIPVATPVAGVGGKHQEEGHAGAGNLGTPHATKVESFGASSNNNDGKNNAGGSGNEGTFENDDGIQVTWTKGEAQPAGFRDVWFAIAFVVHLVAVVATSATLGPAGFAKIKAGDDDGDGSNGSNGGRTLDEHGIFGDKSSSSSFSSSSASSSYGSSSSGSSSSSSSDIPEGFWLAIATISLLVTPVLSILALSVMSRNATLLIQLSLYVGIAISALCAVATLFVAPFAGMFYAIITAVLVCYAKTVWHRIPYAASNLRSGIEAVRSNLGVALVAVGAVPALVIWCLLWTVALLGTMETDWMKNQVTEEDGVYDQNGQPQEEISGLGVFVIMLFLLSFYWTHQVIKNIVRTSVAGVVGTWWFTPLEAASFCSSAVLDSLVRATTYSLGSICFGSLIVAILHVLRNMLRSANNNRRSGDIVRCIAACILLYLERLAEYFNKWAFIYVGLYGYGYIDAGRNVMSLFKARGWTAVISDNLVNRLLAIVSLTIGLVVGVSTLLVAVIFEEFENKGGWLGAGFFIGFLIGIMLSSIMMGVVSSAVDAIIVCFAEAPAEFKESHPTLSSEMESTWAAAWPDLHLGGPVIVSLGGGPGIV